MATNALSGLCSAFSASSLSGCYSSGSLSSGSNSGGSFAYCYSSVPNPPIMTSFTVIARIQGGGGQWVNASFQKTATVVIVSGYNIGYLLPGPRLFSGIDVGYPSDAFGIYDIRAELKIKIRITDSFNSGYIDSGVITLNAGY